MPLTTTLAGGSALIKWLLRDEFTDTLAAGAVNGTPATPGPGGRTVADASSKMTVGAGLFSVAGGANDSTDYLRYAQVTRASGRILICENVNAPNTAGGRHHVAWSFFAANSNNLVGYVFIAGGTLAIMLNTAGNGAGAINVATYANGEDVDVDVILRAAGAYYMRYSAGAWVLDYVYSAGANDLYPRTSGGKAYSVDAIRIPDALYLPTPLAYDTFTRANGALGSSEATGPDGQTAPVKVWQSGGATWTIAGNEAVNTPTEGAEILVNPGMEGAYVGGVAPNWTALGSPNVAESGDAHGGAKAQQFQATVAVDRIKPTVDPTTAVGSWYIASVYAKRTAGANGDVSLFIISGALQRSAGPLIAAAYTQYFLTIRAIAAIGFQVVRSPAGSGDTVIVDDASLKLLTLNTLFSNVETGTADVVCQVELDTIVEGTQAGLVLNLDDKDAPANFVIAYHDGTRCVLEKCVADTYTTVITAVTAYAAGATLVVIKEGTAYSLYYNNAQVGATSTVSDAGIVDNTLHGMFNTYSGNQLDNFLVMPRGTGGEYSALNRWSA